MGKNKKKKKKIRKKNTKQINKKKKKKKKKKSEKKIQNGRLKKSSFFKIANFQKFFAKISQMGPWVGRIE